MAMEMWETYGPTSSVVVGPTRRRFSVRSKFGSQNLLQRMFSFRSFTIHVDESFKHRFWNTVEEPVQSSHLSVDSLYDDMNGSEILDCWFLCQGIQRHSVLVTHAFLLMKEQERAGRSNGLYLSSTGTNLFPVKDDRGGYSFLTLQRSRSGWRIGASPIDADDIVWPKETTVFHL